MESEPNCLLYFSIPTPVHESNTKRAEHWNSHIFFVVKKKIYPRKLGKECHCMICDKFETSQVYHPDLPVRLTKFSLFSFVWTKCRENSISQEETRLLLNYMWHKTEVCTAGARRVSQASTAASVKWLHCGRWFNGCHSSNRSVQRQDSSQS